MKTKEELESLKNEMALLKSKLVELTDDELAVVTGGIHNEWFHNYTQREADFKNYTEAL